MPTPSEIALQTHMRRIQNAKSKVDHSSPKVHSNNFMGLLKYREDCSNYVALMKRNMQLLITMNATMRTIGEIDTFRPIPMPRSKVSYNRKRVLEIEKENLYLGMRLIKVRGTLDTLPPLEFKKYKSTRKFKLKVKKKEPIFIYPETVMEKYKNTIPIPATLELAKKFFRPVVFFELEIQNVRPLGRILIELYTEAAPQVVKEFINMCSDEEPGRILFTRIFPTLWMEGEFIIFDNNVNNGFIEYDMRALDNNLSGGIFSFPLYSPKSGIIHFAISFKPLIVLNGKRVAFARIKKGFRIVDCLQDLGTKNGKPTKKIIVSRCGLIT